MDYKDYFLDRQDYFVLSVFFCVYPCVRIEQAIDMRFKGE